MISQCGDSWPLLCRVSGLLLTSTCSTWRICKWESLTWASVVNKSYLPEKDYKRLSKIGVTIAIHICMVIYSRKIWTAVLDWFNESFQNNISNKRYKLCDSMMFSEIILTTKISIKHISEYFICILMTSFMISDAIFLGTYWQSSSMTYAVVKCTVPCKSIHPLSNLRHFFLLRHTKIEWTY